MNSKKNQIYYLISVSVINSYFLISAAYFSSSLIQYVLPNKRIDIINYDKAIHISNITSFLITKIIMEIINNDNADIDINTKIIILNLIVFPGRADYFKILIASAIITKTKSIIVIG